MCGSDDADDGSSDGDACLYEDDNYDANGLCDGLLDSVEAIFNAEGRGIKK